MQKSLKERKDIKAQGSSGSGNFVTVTHCTLAKKNTQSVAKLRRMWTLFAANFVNTDRRWHIHAQPCTILVSTSPCARDKNHTTTNKTRLAAKHASVKSPLAGSSVAHVAEHFYKTNRLWFLLLCRLLLLSIAYRSISMRTTCRLHLCLSKHSEARKELLQ